MFMGLRWNIKAYNRANSVDGLVGLIDGLVQDCSNSIANALELLQPYTKPSKWCSFHVSRFQITLAYLVAVKWPQRMYYK